VKQLFSSSSKTRRSSREKKQGNEPPPAASFSTKAEEPPTVSSPTKANVPPAALSDTTSDLDKMTGDDSRSSKSKANEDYLPPLSNKRKDPPDLHAKISTKTQKVDKALLENKTVLDDPLSRIDPSIPLVPLAGLPNKKVQDEGTSCA
jgi:hypothetical protein